DIILSINGKNYDKDTYSEALNTIKSTKEGESVLLKIKRGEEILEKEIEIARVSRGYVEEKILDGNIGYIRIKTFGTDITEDFKKAIENIKEKKAETLIIDLRSNPGGSLDTVVTTTDLLIGEGIITTVKDKDGKELKYESDKEETDIPMCVLINSESASASEIMAGALKHYKKATLVGEKTFGKGVVQAIYEFGDGSAMKLTIAKYFTPSGECIDGVGVEPDVEILMPDGEVIAEEKFLTDEDVQFKKAVEVLSSDK
ncbi:MAG: S41 family peptidase, partial [Clostridia bacterium]|nr:S41 family peptidase [Clostridia bacterium]